MVVSDLDDTLLTMDKVLTAKNIETIRKLKSKGVTVVIATGRPLYFIRMVDGLEDLVDYFITSTGLGIWDCKKREMIYKKSFSFDETETITKHLIDSNIDFMRHEELPNNHYCQIYSTGMLNDDFEKREKNFKGLCSSLNRGLEFKSSVFMLPGLSNEGVFECLKKELPWVSIVRLTSPYNDDQHWIEILPPNINKGTAVQVLSDMLGITDDKRIIVGNDHNDTAMLALSEQSYVVENAVAELKERFTVVSSCNENGFSAAVEHAGFI